MFICQSESLLQNKRFARFVKFISIVSHLRYYCYYCFRFAKKKKNWRKGRLEEYLSTSARSVESLIYRFLILNVENKANYLDEE